MKHLSSGRAVAFGTNPVPLIDAIFSWCECLKGNDVIQSSLSALAAGLQAEAIALARVRHGNAQGARGHDCTVRHVGHDTRPPRSTLPALSRSYATALLGPYLTSARSGTVWLRTAVEMEADPALDIFHRRRGLGELAVIPLATGGAASDFLELHYAAPLSPEQNALLTSIAGTLSKSWAGRASGVFVESLLDAAGTEPTRPGGADILGHENPARLSRAEYRVCMLLCRGIAPKAVCEELSISRSTLRTHLRNVYAKTATENLADLMYILLRGQDSAWQGDRVGTGMVA